MPASNRFKALDTGLRRYDDLNRFNALDTGLRRYDDLNRFKALDTGYRIKSGTGNAGMTT